MTKDLRICFVGDSFVNGTGDETKLGWTGRLCAALEANVSGLEITFYNLGVRRDTTEDIGRRFETEISSRLEGDFDTLVVFSFGVNDTTMEDDALRVTSERSVENAEFILSNTRLKHPVLMVGPPPIEDNLQNERIADLDRSFAGLSNGLNIPYFSVMDKLINDPVWRKEVASNDGAHPRSAGYSILADHILKWDAWRDLKA